MRAALGLPTIEELLLGQQRAHQEAQRDLQYRRALYQDQLDQQLQELQLRANLAQFDDLSGLRSRLLLSEHQRRTEQEQALLRHALAQRQSSAGGVAGGVPAGVPSAAAAAGGVSGSPGSLHQSAQSLYEEKLKRIQEQDQAKRRQEELLLLQVRQAMQDQQSGVGVATAVRGLPGAALQQGLPPQLQAPASPQALVASLLRRAEAESLDGEALNGSLRRPSVSSETDRNQNLSASQLNQQTLRPVAMKNHPIPGMTGLATLQDMAEVAVAEAIPRYGSLNDILKAADSESKAFDTADVLSSLKKVEWPDSEDEKEGGPLGSKGQGLKSPKDPAESIETPFFKSYFPALPVEPQYEEGEESDEGREINKAETELAEDGKAAEGDESFGAEVVSNVLQYPYPVDPWYPALNSRKRERRQQGETSDEDDFEDDKDLLKKTNLRANPKKIRSRLSNEMEPGVIEKLPHCRLHRMRTKYTTVSELLFCFQVTESYPNDLMLCCSRCGTWRHAACGGHYKPVSARESTSKPFVAICEHCHAEEKYLEENSRGKHFLERQRIEHVRRGLASSAVMRQMAFMKHGGNYKWPLGSVSATHVGGHIRSVQGRHDKSEKQWGDLASRLSRRFGCSSAKERSRARTKELERLLVCVEDAEGQTDRHNMLLFLERDTRRAKPIGFEKNRRNIFDPEEMQHHQLASSTTDGSAKERTESSSVASESLCARRGCIMKHRFDSLFCSDACGVSALESDLLEAFHEASDIHPSVLRFSY
eukprot:scaffold4244_cov167-Amphora_coffeaeformis.AAC.26